MSNTNAIQQGQMSTRVSDGGVYDARIKAFQENYKAPQFGEIAKDFVDSINADKIKAEKFSESVLGSKVVPSTSKMYESHFQLAKEKFDQLYSDETLEYFSKDDAGMRKWAGMVDQLNQEIKSYEQIYEDSWGTASANGTGITWSDHLARMNNFAGGEDAFFASKGLSLLNPGSFDETMKRIDSRGHTNLTLDLESGTFSYDSTGDLPENWLEPTDPNTAARLFSYQTEQGQFLGSLDFADKAYPTYTNYGEERVKSDNFTVMRNDYQFRLAAVNSYKNNLPEGDPNKDKATGDFLKELEGANSLGSVLDQFQDKILADLKERAKIEKQKAYKPSGGDQSKDTLSSIYKSPPLPTKLEGDEALVNANPQDLVFVTFDKLVYPNGTIGSSTSIIYDKAENKYYSTGTNTSGKFLEVDEYSIDVLDKALTDKNRDFKQSMGLIEYIQSIDKTSTSEDERRRIESIDSENIGEYLEGVDPMMSENAADNLQIRIGTY